MARTSVHPAELTSREREILVMAADGWSAPYIANMLQLSPGTVNTHLLSSFEKLGVYDRAGAVERAQEVGVHRGGAEAEHVRDVWRRPAVGRHHEDLPLAGGELRRMHASARHRGAR
jgi:DNA-binding CsgD family transcriptional regulator